MSSRLHRIEIRNFKAFREFSLDLEGRHLLVYGPNGSGNRRQLLAELNRPYVHAGTTVPTDPASVEP